MVRVSRAQLAFTSLLFYLAGMLVVTVESSLNGYSISGIMLQLGFVAVVAIAFFIPTYLKQFKNYKDNTLDYRRPLFALLVFIRLAMPLAITICGLVSISHNNSVGSLYVWLLFGPFLGSDCAELSRLIQNSGTSTRGVATKTENDPRIKRLLKRYQKEANLSDASIDVSAMELNELLRACGCQRESDLASPVRLDDRAISNFANALGMNFDRERFDYYLHSYVRTEFIESYFKDPTVTSKPAPEGPPAKIPIAEGFQWISARPQDGKEHWEAYKVSEIDLESEGAPRPEWQKSTRH